MLACALNIPRVMLSVPKGNFTSKIRFCSRMPQQKLGIQDPVSTLDNVASTEKLKPKSDVVNIHKSPAISSNLVLFESEKKMAKDPSKSKPLVLLFQWLYAKPSAVQHYCKLYHDIGLDVLTVRGKLSHFLWPPEGLKVCTELFEYLKENRPADEKVFVHAFSIGAYNYTIAMQAALEQQSKSGNFRDKVIGQIFDSIVVGNYDNMSQGIAQILPENKAFRQIITSTLDFYYNVTRKTTRDTYDDLVNHFRKEPIPVPTLFIFSHNDPMCDTNVIQEMLDEWQSHRPDLDVSTVSWQKSKHAAHYREHREEYLRAWKELMQKLKLIES